MPRLLDPLDKVTGKFPFEYTNSASTDVRETWRKAREQMEKNAAEVKEKVKTLKANK